MLNKPVNKPLTSKPGNSATDKPAKTGRASDEYKNGMLQALRTNFRQVSNILQEGVDADGGYLVPEEYDNRLIDVLTEENIMRTLGKIITPAMPPLVRKPEKNPPMPVLSWMIPRLILRSVTVRKLLLLPLLDIGYSLEVNYTIFWQ